MNVFELFAKLSLDTNGFEEKLNSARDKANGIGSALGTVAKVGGAAIGAAASAVGALTQQAVGAYGQYQQLEGGVQKLFGEASDKMMEYASNAYKTSGMSANQYMEQATSFAASLIQSYEGDTSRAADQADKAMRAISDNFNTFGGDMSMIQGAFQGFAKQNYTMLDNLKLGYGGTKNEMKRLVEDANEYAKSIGQASDLSMDNFGDIVEAIDLIQQKQNIAGTTSKEAANTIEGSMGSVKAAWENLVTGFADPDADLGVLIDNVMESGTAALTNMIPTIERALVGIGEGIQKIVPVITEKLPELVDQILPPLLDAASQLVDGLANALPAILSALVDVAPKVINTLIEAIISMLPKLIEAGLQLIIAVADGIGQNLDKIIPSVVQAILTIVKTIMNNLPKILNAALQIIKGLALGIVKAIPVLVKELPKIIKAFVQFILGAIPQIIQAGIELLTSLIAELPTIIDAIVESLPDIIDGIVTGLLSGDNIAKMIEAGVQLFVAIVSNIPKIVVGIIKAIPQIIEGIINGFMNLIDNFTKVGREIINGILKGIKERLPELLDHLGLVGQLVASALRNKLKIKSPSRVTQYIGDMIMQGLEDGIDEGSKDVYKSLNKVSDGIYDALNQDYDMGMSGRMNSIASSRSAFVGAQNGYMGDSDAYEEEIIIPQGGADSGRNLTVILELDKMQLGRAVYRLNNQETQRVGVQLAGVNA